MDVESATKKLFVAAASSITDVKKYLVFATYTVESETAVISCIG